MLESLRLEQRAILERILMRYVPFDSKLSPNKWVYLGLFLVLAALYGIASPPVSLSDAATTSDACYMAQKFVKDELKAPATSTFAPCSEPDSLVTQNGTEWTVRSWVDAQNGFGAMLRTDFTAQLTYRPATRTWTLAGLQMH